MTARPVQRPRSSEPKAQCVTKASTAIAETAGTNRLATRSASLWYRPFDSRARLDQFDHPGERSLVADLGDLNRQIAIEVERATQNSISAAP